MRFLPVSQGAPHMCGLDVEPCDHVGGQKPMRFGCISQELN